MSAHPTRARANLKSEIRNPRSEITGPSSRRRIRPPRRPGTRVGYERPSTMSCWRNSKKKGWRAALGCITLGRRFIGVVHEIIDDRSDVVMRGTQGLTVGCARCHDHKFDPISTRDYYSLYGVFAGSFEKTVPLDLTPEKTE